MASATSKSGDESEEMRRRHGERSVSATHRCRRCFVLQSFFWVFGFSSFALSFLASAGFFSVGTDAGIEQSPGDVVVIPLPQTGNGWPGVTGLSGTNDVVVIPLPQTGNGVAAEHAGLQ